nr:MAG TPA: hypothetical protein [Caudoviricetes sp.]
MRKIGETVLILSGNTEVKYIIIYIFTVEHRD